jgi:hypothetical protein
MKHIVSILCTLLLNSCYSPIYNTPIDNQLSAENCERAEAKIENSMPPQEMWKVHANLAECYLNSIWFKINGHFCGVQNGDYCFSEVKRWCEEAIGHFNNIPLDKQLQRELYELGQSIDMTCNSEVEMMRIKPLDPTENLK